MTSDSPRMIEKQQQEQQNVAFGLLSIALVIVVQILFLINKQNKTNAPAASKEGNNNEARRRLQHCTTGQVLVGISYVLPLAVCKVTLLIGILLVLFVCIRYKTWYQTTFSSLLRPNEISPSSSSWALPGAFWFLVGTWVTLMTVDLHLARYAVLCLSYADPMAAWMGQSISSPRIWGRATLVGMISCFVTATVLGILCDLSITKDTTDPQKQEQQPSARLATSFVGALACTVAEAMPMGNDNLLIPIVTAGAVALWQKHQ